MVNLDINMSSATPWRIYPHRQNRIYRVLVSSLLALVFLGLSSGCMLFKRTPLEPAERFDRAVAILEENFIDRSGNPVKLDLSVRPDIDKLVKQLDSSVILYSAIEVAPPGVFGGIGVSLILRGDYPEIESSRLGAPARMAGLRKGDRITEINGTGTQGLDVPKVLKMLRGEPGSEVVLKVAPRSGAELTVRLKREVIKMIQPSAYMIHGNSVAYLRIEEFNTKTPDAVKKEVYRLQKEKSRGLIVDIRNNGGGHLDSIVDVTQYFLKYDAVVCRIGGRRDGKDKEFTSAGGFHDTDMPLVVLVDNKTSSGAEIMAAALKDHKRALLIGEKTAGTIDIKTYFPIGDGSLLGIRTALAFRPSGAAIDGQETEPDKVVVMTEEARASVYEKMETEPAGYRGDEAQDFQLNAAIKEVEGDRL